jgi:hypothetical protein
LYHVPEDWQFTGNSRVNIKGTGSYPASGNVTVQQALEWAFSEEGQATFADEAFDPFYSFIELASRLGLKLSK